MKCESENFAHDLGQWSCAKEREMREVDCAIH